jgi:internalin A
MNPALTLPDVRPLATLCVFLFVSSLPVKASPSPEATTPKTFADWCLNKNNLSVETLHTINALLQEAKTQDCHQAEKLLSTNTKLSLENRQITDLRPLSTLTNLRELSLENIPEGRSPLSKNKISDLTPLSTLTKLTKLTLRNNQIVDITPLSTLTTLTYLSLDNNQIVDIKPLSTLTTLTYLSLYKNQIADLRPLSTLTKLTILSLDNNEIADLRPLSTLPNLTELYLNNNQIADLRPLSSLTKLTGVYLRNNPTLTDKTCPVKPASICSFAPPSR